MLNFPTEGETKYTLPEKLAVDRYLIPGGTVVALCKGNILVLPKDCYDARGFVITKRIFRVTGTPN